MEKPFEFAYGFKAHCTSINERLSRLEGCLHSTWNNKINQLTPFGNEFLLPKKYCLDRFPYDVSIETEGYL